MATIPIDEKKNEYEAEVEFLPAVGDYEAADLAASNNVRATRAEIDLAESQLDTMPVERARKILTNIVLMHQHDQNFDMDTLERIKTFLHDEDVQNNPNDHEALIHAMRIEALLVTNNSPYAMVRGCVDVTDDMDMPSITFRMLLLGILACGIGSAINQIFSIRYPGISLDSSSVQLLAYPAGKFLARILPAGRFTLFGKTFSFNPGPWNRKEHMLAMPKWYGEKWPKNVGYQMLNTLGCNFAGIGIAGLCRTFLVHPSYCVWPGSLGTLALNRGFHQDEPGAVPGPRKKIYSWSRMKLFYVSFIAMLTFFNWIAWINPNNAELSRWTSTYNGIGLNPFPSLDWNHAFSISTPAFAVNNGFLGAFISLWVIVGVYYTNAYNTGYLPMMSNGTFTNKAKSYNVKEILGDNMRLDPKKFQAYLEPYMAASNIANYLFFFAKYTAGGYSLWRNMKKSFSRSKNDEEDIDALGEDIHYRLMKKYPEVPEWWYLVVLVLALVFGMLGVGLYPSHTTPAVVIYGVIMSLIFVIPLGIVTAVAGGAPTLNVLAEFIGGLFDPGNALQMNYFRMYGYVTAANAIGFASDLKLGHYTKIRPRHTFAVQILGIVINSLVCASILNFQMGIKDVCDQENPPFRFFCMGQLTFYTATVFWGSLGPTMIFGKEGRYKWLCMGFLLGPVVVLLVWGLQKMFPKSKLLRSVHSVVILDGCFWYPTNLSMWWTLYVSTWISWNYVKKRYLAFWSKYNFILSVGLSCGIAISGIIQFLIFGLGVDFPHWWGTRAETGCNKRGNVACARLKIPAKGYFGPEPGHYT